MENVFNPKRVIEIYSQFVEMQKHISVGKVSNGGRHVIIPLVDPNLSFWESCRIIGKQPIKDSDKEIIFLEVDVNGVEGSFVFKLFLAQKLNTMINKYGGYDSVKGQDIIILSEGKKEGANKGKKEYTDITMVMHVK